MTAPLMFTAYGNPQPQGSYIQGTSKEGKRYFRPDNPLSLPWREVMQTAAEYAANAMMEPGSRQVIFTGPVTVEAIFWLDRPKGHYRTGRFAHLLRDDAPEFPHRGSHGGRGATSHDVDKYARALLDAMTLALVYADDCQVIRLVVEKLYDPTAPGVNVRVDPYRRTPSEG